MNNKVKTVKTLIEQSKGKFFTVTFIKRTTGEVRVMNARLGVKKGLTGGGAVYNAAEKNLLTCYDITKKEYRTINLDAVLTVKVNGLTFNID